MKVPIEWLKELIKFKVTPEQLAHKLTMAGLETILENDVLDVDVLPNRADCWSIRGVAREVGAIGKLDIRYSKFDIQETSKKVNTVISVEVQEKKLCPRYMARVVENVKVGPSPKWLKDRLEKAGVRSINNVVDVTNYLMLEIGQPMHAFDAALIEGGKIIVRPAKPKEKVLALDEKEYELNNNMLVIADASRAIAIAGVMGLANTGVTNETSTVMLESAYFDPISVYETSKQLKLRSDSSIRFEHGVDWHGVEEALDRAAGMIAELGKGEVLKGKIDKKGTPKKPKVVTLRPARVNQVLGTRYSVKEMLAILKRLGFKVAGSKVTIPLFRAQDVCREADLIEEIARIYGYDKMPVTMPNTSFPGKQVDKFDQFRSQVTEILVGCGLNEATTYSMVGPPEFACTGESVDGAVKIDNPMTVEASIMRTALLPSLLNVLAHNLNRQLEDVLVFEVGKIFKSSGKNLPQEKWVVAGAAVGSPFLSAVDKVTIDYFYIKGVLENLFAALGVKQARFVETNNPLVQQGKGGEVLGAGYLGQLHPDIATKFGLEKPVYFFELDLEALFKASQKSKRYQTLPKFPAVTRDISLIAPPEINCETIAAVIKQIGEDLIEDVFLFDKYKDSLAFRLVFRHLECTLTDDEVNELHQKICQEIQAKLNVRIR
ncbi:phenylalanine--tRNA ligase subunit beta [Candidatus Saganbacteria bacterium CG08_land_8_20_14_0_20_45_16]|uniref:Phenylalanine--tRNA ligase beta subunit n=1 Tax=Candidatus Saganbacteria bacterium CG08_land_8_20_14_0_20_45_16 TaxID=2014293 RepID=A0A2H0XTX9_UNCSA|nr:MAG: phenylalanine--tRNA ligase subunit beta [Candidatus Saganbacteria bacterium CG08_land_8_20_14_0_20_45_16]